MSRGRTLQALQGNKVHSKLVIAPTVPEFGAVECPHASDSSESKEQLEIDHEKGGGQIRPRKGTHHERSLGDPELPTEMY